MASYRWTVQLGHSLGIACALAVGVAAQTTPAQKPKVVSARTVPIVSAEGKDNFETYCAVCHGKEGKGNGPAAPAMKTPVPDLTTLAKRNNGKFDSARVEDVIRNAGSMPTPAHGVETMPIWGTVFKTEDQAKATLRIKNLVTYLKSIQEPASK
jgi:mono/diheme cytochrome c family protein